MKTSKKSIKPNIKGKYKKLTFIIIAIGILLRFALASISSVSGDACWQLSASRFIAENKRFPLYEPLGRDEPFWAPPLFHIMAAVLYSAFGLIGSGAADFAMRMLSPLLGSLTLVLAYLISKKLFDEKTAFHSMLFTAFIPISIDYNVFSYVDGAVAFFVALSVYFALDDKYIKSSVSAGLAGLAKYNGMFVLPLIVYIACKRTKDKKSMIKKMLVIFLIPVAIASPWLVRNYIDFGNPFWPFLNFMFNGMKTTAFESANLQAFKLGNIFSVNSIIFTYLAMFGVPDGDYRNLFFFSIPHINFLVGIWLFGTIIFILPFMKSFAIKDKLKGRILLIWILSYVAVLLLYIANAAWTATRFFLPAIPALGMLYGVGLSNINSKKTSGKSLIFLKFFNILIFLVIIGFVFAQTAKIALASKEWSKFSDDFKWIEENTGKDELIIPGVQCLSYHTKRGALPGAVENIKKADYVWVNRNFNLERRSIASNEILKAVQENSYKKVYENKKTGTAIYKITPGLTAKC